MRDDRFKAGQGDAGDVTLDAVGVFDGAIILRKVGGMVYARGGVSRAAGSSTSYTDCTDPIPVGFRPAADTGLPAPSIFNTAVTYQYAAFANGDMKIRMSDANGAGLAINGFWPAATL